MKRIVIMCLMLILTAPALFSQKALKPVRASIKAKNGAQAMSQINNLEKDSVIKYVPELYDLGRQAQILLNNALNEKAYLKQKFDTASLFNTTYQIYTYTLRCEEAEQRMLALEGKKMKYHKQGGQTLRQYYPNICAGSRYFFSKKQYAEAMKYLRYALDIPNQAIWGTTQTQNNQREGIQAAALYIRAAYLNNNFDETERYAAVALADTAERSHRTSMEYLALSAGARGDSIRYRALLLEGLERYPQHELFFTHLVDDYAAHRNYTAIQTMAERRLQTDSTDIVALDAKTLALIYTNRFDEAVNTADKSFCADSTDVDAYYYAGLAYSSLADTIVLPTNMRSNAYKKASDERNHWMKCAIPYLERYRQLAPKDVKRWGPLLYRAYFALNDGAKFAEIEALLAKEE